MTQAVEQGLLDEMIRLGPWHIEIDVTPTLTTAAAVQPPGTYADEVSFYSPQQGHGRTLEMIWPAGLAGRSVLDCACNNGAYLFWAKEHGAGECFGFDVRQHWIDQADFLLRNRTAYPTDAMRFDVADLYDLPTLGLQQFDVTFFRGILYHLPDPVAGLRIAADLTREILVVNTATWNAAPDGALVVSDEPDDRVLSGVYGLNWYPTGPEVLRRILAWAGFPEMRVHWWNRDTVQGRDLGRIEVIAARSAALLHPYDRSVADG